MLLIHFIFSHIINTGLNGKIKEGYYADVIIFNPETFKDKADYTNAFLLAEGVVYSIINGKIVIENGNFTNVLNGKVLAKKDDKK